MNPDTFSKIHPKLQLAWDATSLKALQFCPRYYQLQNLDGWQADNVNLEFGRFVADGFELYQKLRLDGLTKEDAIVQVVRQALDATWNADGTQWGGRYEDMWKCEGTEKYKNDKGNRAKCPFAFEAAWFPGDAPNICGSCGSGIRTERRYVPADSKKHRLSLIRALIWYGLDQPEILDEGLKPYVFPNGQKAVELSGRMPLPYKTADNEDYILTWNFDYIGDFGQELFIVDNKTTTKGLNDTYFSQYSPDTQFDTYAMVGSIAFPALKIQGTLVDAVSISVSGVEFGRRPFYKNEAQNEEHLRDLGVWLKIAEAYALMDYWPMNKRSCWLCPFKGVCSQSPKMRPGYLASTFVKHERWDPMRQR